MIANPFTKGFMIGTSKLLPPGRMNPEMMMPSNINGAPSFELVPLDGKVARQYPKHYLEAVQRRDGYEIECSQQNVDEDDRPEQVGDYVAGVTSK